MLVRNTCVHQNVIARNPDPDVYREKDDVAISKGEEDLKSGSDYWLVSLWGIATVVPPSQ